MKYLFGYKTKIGKIYLVEENKCITHLFFKDLPKFSYSYNETALIQRAYLELEEYLNGKREEFTIPIHIEGTPFQKRVWEVLLEIPYGKTISYQEEARMIGNEKAVRAVGGANHKNPLPIFIPCHRVIGKNQKLVGYGGGLLIKEYLLNLEKEKRKEEKA